MSEKMREEFQVWFDANHKTENHSFNFAMSSAMFDAWQASRAALVVELPENCKGMALTVDELRVMLDEIGVTLK